MINVEKRIAIAAKTAITPVIAIAIFLTTPRASETKRDGCCAMTVKNSLSRCGGKAEGVNKDVGRMVVVLIVEEAVT